MSLALRLKQRSQTFLISVIVILRTRLAQRILSGQKKPCLEHARNPPVMHITSSHQVYAQLIRASQAVNRHSLKPPPFHHPLLPVYPIYHTDLTIW